MQALMTPRGDDVDPGVRDDGHHHRDLVHAGLLEHELGQAGRLLDGRVATDLAVVGGIAPVGADRVEERERAAAGADHQAEVAVELRDVAGHAAVVHPVDGLAGDLERRRLPRLAGLLLADAELGEQLCLTGAGLVLHVHVGVDRDEGPVLELRERVDLREGHVPLDEELGQPGEDRGGAGERLARHAGGGDHLLGLVVRERVDVREVPAADAVGMGLGDLLDVDPAHVGEEHHGLLARPVPDDAGVVLLLDRHPGVHQDAARHVPVDLQGEDVPRVGLGLIGRVGELDAARLHPAPGEDLRLDHGRPADVLRDAARLRGSRREAM
jgi:hypothetical protein